MSFDTVFIANRGEIAVRVARSARELGYRVVGVASEADARGLHARTLDAFQVLPGNATAATYLQIDLLVAAALELGAGAVHPGYGFLAESAEFARACAEAGLVFIGPSPSAIDAMGDKVESKRRMHAAGVPTLPGYLPEGEAPASAFLSAAEEVGYPLLVKAAAGGGGRGIRLVTGAAELPAALGAAADEAARFFGSPALMLERFVRGGRHVEIQVFADSHGNTVHLFERECSVQRRRQKVIEEAPSPVVDDDLRARMGADAVRAAEAIGYVGAGTVEFLLDESGRYYFLEMNTRLQVEHPVTELVTGEDLVAWQLQVASGQPLPKSQGELSLRGHAIEARLYAEDPTAGFAPQSGAVEHFAPSAHLRVDAGVASGDLISPHYDAMVAKFVAFGPSREDARRRLRRGLQDSPLVGPRTNQGFLIGLLDSRPFRDHTITTDTLDAWDEDHALLSERPPTDEAWILAALVSLRGEEAASSRVASAVSALGRSLGTLQVRTRTVSLVSGAYAKTVELHATGGGWKVAGREYRLQRVGESSWRVGRGSRWESFFAHVGMDPQSGMPRVTLELGAGPRAFAWASPYPETRDASDPARIEAPFAGTLLRVLVSPGEAVNAGQVVAVLEAMKMETQLSTRAAGRVKSLARTAGESVEAGALVVELALDVGGESIGDER